MISATVAPERRWRMSITCLSRRERAVAGAADSDLLAISVTLIRERLEETSSWELYVEKSTVLKIQQSPGFVNRQLFGYRRTRLMSPLTVRIRITGPPRPTVWCARTYRRGVPWSSSQVVVSVV